MSLAQPPSAGPRPAPRYDVLVIGAGHNGLAAAAYLARAGREVLVLERDTVVGGAARSAAVFPGYDARLSAYSYLVSLLPQQIVDDLGLDLTLRRRTVSSYTPVGRSGILVDAADPERTRAGLGVDAQAWGDFYGLTGEVAQRLFPTLTEPLRSAHDVRALLGPRAWQDLVEHPIGRALERRFTDDAVRGIVLTDGLIGTFTSAGGPTRLANRCLLYHVIGRGTGAWDVPVGGMGAVTEALRSAAESAGALIRTGAEVTGLVSGPDEVVVSTADGARVRAEHVVAAVAPAVLDRLLGVDDPRPPPEGAQLKVNMLLARLPRLRDASVAPERAFAGTFHINEGYGALEQAYREAAAGRIPAVPPCEVYCHSLTDRSILGPDLQARGVHTLTLFGLHLPARLFRADPEGSRAEALKRTLESVDSVLAEPLEDCLLDPGTIEARSPVDLERSLGMPGGHIFHGDLQWPWAEHDDDVGRWGTETGDPRVHLCGAGARRGGGVSAIPGRNVAASLLGEAALAGG